MALRFGTLMADATDDQIGVVETILSTAIVGTFLSTCLHFKLDSRLQ